MGLLQFFNYNLLKIYIYIIKLITNDHRKMQHSSLELSHRDELNGGSFILLQSLDDELLNKMSKISIMIFLIYVVATENIQ